MHSSRALHSQSKYPKSHDDDDENYVVENDDDDNDNVLLLGKIRAIKTSGPYLV